MAIKALHTALVISAGNPTFQLRGFGIRYRYHCGNFPVPIACSGGLVGSHLSHMLSLDANLSQISFFCCFSYFTVLTAVGQLLISS